MPRDAAINTFLIELKNDVDKNAAFFFGLIRIRHERRWEWEDACPSGYTYRQTNRLCYKAFNRLSKYNDAKATCSSYGGTLAMPRNAAIDNFLINLKNAVDLNTAFFFGLNCIGHERRWVWEDGTALGSFHPWGPREPSDSGGDQDCVEYVSATWYEAALRDTWNDMACATPRKFICQVPPT
ncbi:PREDICTED: lactose-binding lectin l-2-like [Branchiostoma belcheri]|uniref:Lactose-binding lectin l-2-like n=1 Tax=Branchiostoma belcheri TaxID=7741 RepID=A0A6P4XVR6_BRABE|nr:PREDICTED: lactose-binding lectin l-2-like [Branchiostoma belcheri]